MHESTEVFQLLSQAEEEDEQQHCPTSFFGLLWGFFKSNFPFTPSFSWQNFPNRFVRNPVCPGIMSLWMWLACISAGSQRFLTIMRNCSVVSASTTDAAMTLVLVSQVLQEMAHYGMSSLEADFIFRMDDPYSVFKVGSAETAAVLCLNPLKSSTVLRNLCRFVTWWSSLMPLCTHKSIARILCRVSLKDELLSFSVWSSSNKDEPSHPLSSRGWTSSEGGRIRYGGRWEHLETLSGDVDLDGCQHRVQPPWSKP